MTKKKQILSDPSQPRYIYLILDPTTDPPTPIYVGQATCVLQRIGQHLALTPHTNPGLQTLLSKLKSLVLFPKITVLEVTTLAKVTEREQYWIAHYATLHPGLANIVFNPKRITGRDQRYYVVPMEERWRKDGIDTTNPDNNID